MEQVTSTRKEKVKVLRMAMKLINRAVINNKGVDIREVKANLEANDMFSQEEKNMIKQLKTNDYIIFLRGIFQIIEILTKDRRTRRELRRWGDS